MTTTDALVCSNCMKVIPVWGADGRCPNCGSRHPLIMNEFVLARMVADGLVTR